MKLIFYVFLLFLQLSLTALADTTTLTNENIPPEFEAAYDVYKSGIHAGKMHVSLKKNGDEIIYESTTKPVGLATLFVGGQQIIDYAQLKQFNNGYRTIEFKHEVKNSKKNRNEHYLFDWENLQAEVQYKDRNNILNITPTTLDNFSSQLLLMRKPSAKNIENKYSVISKGRLKEYVFKLETEETIKTKLGDINAHKFVRKKQREGKKTTYLGWYAKDLNYIPVRLDKFENGSIDTSIRIININWL